MEEYQMSSDQGETKDIINFNPIKIELNTIKYELNIESKENIITFTLDGKNIINTNKYTKTMSLKEIRDLNNVFYELNSPNEFYGYIRTLSDNKQLILKKDKNKMSIILILEISPTKEIINIDLFPVKKNDIWEQLMLKIKEKNKEIDIIKQEGKTLRNDIFTLKQENKEFKKLISSLIKENKELKNEATDIQIQKEEKIKGSDHSESKDKEIKKDNIITVQEDKKVMTQYVKAYDPKIEEDGNLINKKQIVIQLKKDELFEGGYKIL